MHRRKFLRTGLAAGAIPAALSLPGCESLVRTLAESCPEDPEESGGVDWTPDVLHPVFYGYRDYTPAEGAPATVRMWFPTYDGSPQYAGMLKLCLIRWPVVLLLHGQPPHGDCGAAAWTDYHQRWSRLPAVLARCGYVVAVPSHPALLPQSPAAEQVAGALRVIDWARGGWEHSRWVDARASQTAVVGHSYGALLAARVAAARADISAYVGLSGPWAELGDRVALLGSLGAPAFFMWATGDPLKRAFEDLDDMRAWAGVPRPKHAAVFPGEHFDYISPWPGCAFSRGGCTLVEAVAADLTALFLARHVKVGTSNPRIPVDLRPPAVTLTDRQHFFAGAHLAGLEAFRTRAGCSMRLRWETDEGSGARDLGP